MSSRPPPKQQSLVSLLWEVLRLGARALWGSRANPVRPVLERQQALAVLGLPPNATRQQIKRRYRVLAKQHHPDRGGDQRQMQRIIAAYEFLMKDQTGQ
jgi:DnaJ-domain-containing protein 1